MRLDQALVIRNLCDSRTEAQELIESGDVVVNGAVVCKQTKQVTDTDELVVTRRRTFVSRGGEKLEGALLDLYGSKEKIHDAMAHTTVLDVGSSTGGFTDCVLSYGADHVDAVDVGTEQLHGTLRGNARVSVFENTDIRDFKTETTYDSIVADLSFIPLEHVFDSIVSFGKKDTAFFLLLKPQFEVGKGNTKKGIVKDQALVQETLSKYEALAQQAGLKDVRISECVIQGGDGNQEYFLHGKK